MSALVVFPEPCSAELAGLLREASLLLGPGETGSHVHLPRILGSWRLRTADLGSRIGVVERAAR